MAKRRTAKRVGVGRAPAAKGKPARASPRKRAGRPARAAKAAARKKVRRSAARQAATRPRRKTVPTPGLSLREIRARIGLLRTKFDEVGWLRGLYIYGPHLMERPTLRRVNILVLQQGLKQPAQQRKAKEELRRLLRAVLPLRLDLKFTDAVEVGRLIEEGNPAARALLGHTETVYAR